MSPLRRDLQRLSDYLLFLVLSGSGHVLTLLALQGIHHRLVFEVLKRRRLFDREYYLAQHEDVARLRIRPLMHYIQRGDREGRWPMCLFDPLHYEKEAAIPPTRKVNRLLHYACIGRYRGFSPSPWFDVRYYLSRNKDVARSGVDPLLHFWRWGGSEGRDPSARFASAHYLRTTPEATEWAMNPLVHYLEQGQYEGRSPLPSVEGGTFPLSPPLPTRPAVGAWDALAPLGSRSDAVVDVIVPVYAGPIVTLRCIHSVLQAGVQETPYELIVINDGSPEQELVSTLTELAGRGLFTLIHNDQNRGFVHTVNRGVTLHPERDVVLLNSDTEVYRDWLDRLRAVARSRPRVATVTPLSNNATLCSYPNFLHDNPYPLEIAYDDLDRLTAEVNSDQAVQAPTGVGFCLYLTRKCLQEVGLFDEVSFGRGYGEENDYCQRAIRQGWHNWIACDVFVRHWGGASFQGERPRRLKTAMAVLKARYPNYHRDIRRFIQADPLREMRARLDLARLERVRGQKNVLLVTHARGGGTERHVLEDTQRLRATGHGVFLMRPGARSGRVLLAHPDIDALPNLSGLDLRDHSVLLSLLKHLAITEIHLHHLIDFSRDAPEALQQLAADLQVPVRVMIHDYTAICPRVNLVDKSGIYCGEPGRRECRACIRRNGSEFGRVDIGTWRSRYDALFRSARSVVVPDPDVAVRLGRYFPAVQLEVQPHEPPLPGPFRFRHESLEAAGHLRVVVIGAIGKIKGYETLLACVKDARKRSLPIDFAVFGFTMNDVALKREGATVTGRYLEQYADSGLESLSPHCIWFPYVWPETYSYTLSIALRCKRPIFAFDLGAIASRLHALNAAQHLMPLDLALKPRHINDRFLSYRETLPTSEKSTDEIPASRGESSSPGTVPTNRPEPRREPVDREIGSGVCIGAVAASQAAENRSSDRCL